MIELLGAICFLCILLDLSFYFLAGIYSIIHLGVSGKAEAVVFSIVGALVFFGWLKVFYAVAGL